MNVMSIANSIGLVPDGRGEVSGTIDEAVVLDAIATLAASHPGNDDVFADAVMRVELARSAGVEQREANSVLNRSATVTTVQLRYRSEMIDVFTDLAIDIGIRSVERLAESNA